MTAELLLILCLIALNGALAMSELAIVQARPARLRVMAAEGRGGARTALRLAEEPGRFLSTVQVGITLVGILSGAFSGATLGVRASDWLVAQGLSDRSADAVGVGAVVVAITYLSLIVGELVPKQIALRAPEAVAVRAAPWMAALAHLARPVVWVLDRSGRLVLAALGQSGGPRDGLSEAEVKSVLAEAQDAGVIGRAESEMLSGVMRLADRTARALMTPRREVEAIDIGADAEDIRAQLRRARRSRLPVRRGSSDEILGVLVVRDALDAVLAGRELDVAALMRPAPAVSDLASAPTVLEALRSSPSHMVLVFDEYGQFEGVITTGDILEAIAGAFEADVRGEQALVAREDGSFLVAGWMPVDEFADRLGIALDPDPDYETVAGLVLSELKRLPELGESFTRGGWQFEIVDLDGRRIDNVPD